MRDMNGVDHYKESGTCPNCGERYESWVEIEEKGFSKADLTNVYRATSVCIDREQTYTSLYIHSEPL